LLGIHPAMTGAGMMYEEENLLVIQNVGYPQPNLSHFRSKDIITSGSASEVVLNSGWMGRMLNGLHPDYPLGYPSEAFPHPIALTIGSSGSPTCQGYSGNLSAVIRNLTTDYNQGIGSETFPDTPYGNELKYITGIMGQTEVYLDAVSEAAGKATNLSVKYPSSGNSLSDQLKMVARLMAGGLKTQVYVVSLGGWDTHADQAEEGATETGKHASLLKQLSDAIYAFQDDIHLLGIEDDVIGFVFSEFGRRIRSNASFGTDHGTAWPAMLFGKKINPTVLGSNPVIPANPGKDENLSMQYDFRSVYASIFSHWFEADEASIAAVLYSDFELLPILKTPSNNIRKEKIGPVAEAFPNPFRNRLSVSISCETGMVEISLFNSSGQLVKRLHHSLLQAGSYLFEFDLPSLNEGTYILVYRNREHSGSILLQKN